LPVIKLRHSARSGEIMRARPTNLIRLGSRFLLLSLLLVPASWLLAQELRIKPVSNPSLPSFNPRRTPVVDVIDKVKAAVVNIHSERTISSLNRDDMLALTQTQNRVNGMGTGIVIDPRGYIVTNHHVVDDVQMLRVKLLDGASYPAKVVARDPEADLAILKIDAGKPLQTIPLGTASDLMLGETVIAIGNAFGYEHTSTVGIVSALKRDVSLNKEVSYKSLIQTDASINPGNSGGPLLNIHGELIGVNVAIRAGAQGIGFAIPTESMLKTVAELMSVRRRTGLVHGLVIKDSVDSSTTPVRRWGVIEQVAPESAAARAGLQVGDVLEKVGDMKTFTALDLERALLDKPAGEKHTVVLRRGASRNGEGGQEMALELTLKPTEKAQGNASNDVLSAKLGLKFQAVPAANVVAINPQLRGGLNVVEVNPDSPAAKAGIQRGDILIGLHQWETITIENAVFVVTHPDLATFSPVRFYLIRSGQLRRGYIANFE
jgi:serine protease Do